MTTPIAQGPVDVNVRPVAWLHDQPERYDVVHDEARALWLKAWPKQVEHYTIPLYRHERREPLTTEAARTLLKDALGIDPLLDGNMLKMLRAVERAHGIGPKQAGEARGRNGNTLPAGDGGATREVGTARRCRMGAGQDRQGP